MKESLKQMREGFRTETLTLCNIGQFEENHYFVTQVHMLACQIYFTFMLVQCYNCKRYSILAQFVDFLIKTLLDRYILVVVHKKLGYLQPNLDVPVMINSTVCTFESAYKIVRLKHLKDLESTIFEFSVKFLIGLAKH